MVQTAKAGVPPDVLPSMRQVRHRETFATSDREPVDVCIIVEGAYPYVRGGLSTWIDNLIRRHSSLTFSVVAILPNSPPPEAKFSQPPNRKALHHLYLGELRDEKRRRAIWSVDRPRLFEALDKFFKVGGRATLAEIETLLSPFIRAGRASDLLNSPLAWNMVRDLYNSTMDYESFLHFFWAWRTVFSGLIATLSCPLPTARIYHSVSTGYAGVLAARAASKTGRPVLITEHGIYTNERRIEILQADWIVDTLDRGFLIQDTRRDLRDFWTMTFESYARTCYDACTEIITLNEANQSAQIALGAQRPRMRVIPNGVDYRCLSGLPRASAAQRPTIALIGRVVPIKDIKTYLHAVDLLRRRFPDLQALVLGPTDEQPDYFEECRAIVAERGLSDHVEFTGSRNVAECFPFIHVNVLTSVSESQPLIILEAGAAGIPTVSTDVGGCREMLEGRRDEQPALGEGGILTDIVSPEQTADAVAALLDDPERRQRMGQAMQQRIMRYYDLDLVDEIYSHIYRRYCDLPSQPPN